MINFRFKEIAVRTKQALSRDNVLGRHLIPLFDDIEKGGVEYILHAFDNNIPVRSTDVPEEFQRVGDRLDVDFRSFIDNNIATAEMLGGTLTTDETVCQLGDALNAHEAGDIRLNSETYEKYAEVYDLLSKDLFVSMLLVYVAYQELGRNHCAYRCLQQMDEESKRFAKFIDKMTA